MLERGEVANTWKTERWDSLRLLTPNWLTRLPGLAYDGEDPDGFMAVPELIEFLERYAEHVDAPVRTRTTVTAVSRPSGEDYLVETADGSWEAEAVVIASGAFNRPHVPAVSASLPRELDQITPLDYKRPEQLRAGPVLVVGASATGIQLADELLRSGREVTVAVGEHVRMPRTYRGRDIMWWLEQIGRLDERYDEVDDLVRARHVPSPQLAGARPSGPRPERPDGERRDPRRAAGGGGRQHRLLLRLAAQRLQPRRPQAQPPARHDRPMGRRPTAVPAPSRRASTSTRRPGSTWPTSTRCSGPPASAPTTPGCSSR